MIHEKINKKLPSLKEKKLGKKAQDKEDKIKINLQMENKNRNDWRFKIHWNNLEWFNPQNCSKENKTFCVSSKGFYLKDNDKTSHWVGHSKLPPWI